MSQIKVKIFEIILAQLRAEYTSAFLGLGQTGQVKLTIYAELINAALCTVLPPTRDH